MMKALSGRSKLLPYIALVIMAACSAAQAGAVPAKPGKIPFVQADGTTLYVTIVGDEHFHYYISAEGDTLEDVDGMLVKVKSEKLNAMRNRMTSLSRISSVSTSCGRGQSPAPTQRKNSQLLFDDSFPATGEQRVLVVVVDYPNATFSIDNPQDYFNRMLNERGFSDYNATGSAADYFDEASFGAFSPQFDVYGPLTLANSRSYYGANDYYGNDEFAWMMAVEACEQIDDSVDFTLYDRNSDGVIDNIFIFYAGLGENNGGRAYTVWPHSWYITEAAPDTAYVFDGVQLDRYACSNEWTGSAPDGVGTFIHEFSHVLGLPDLYYTGSLSSPFTLGAWDVLDTGSYNNDSRTPPMYSLFERYALGWIEPREITGTDSITLATTSQGEGCIIPTEGEEEFFLLENRQQTGWDSYIPGHGMLVWHIDYDYDAWYNNTVNNVANHQRVDIEEADGTQTEGSRSGDAFPGTAGVTTFTDDTTPSMLTWDGTSLGLPITDITEEDSTITFRVAASETAAVKTITRGSSETITYHDINLPRGINITIRDGETRKWIAR